MTHPIEMTDNQERSTPLVEQTVAELLSNMGVQLQSKDRLFVQNNQFDLIQVELDDPYDNDRFLVLLRDGRYQRYDCTRVWWVR